MAASANLRVDSILTQHTEMLRNRPGVFIADRVLPIANVSNATGSFYRVSNGFGFASNGFAKRTAGARFPNITVDVSKVTAYTLAESGVETAVDDVQRDIAGEELFDLQVAATERCFADAMIARELDCAGTAFSATTFSGYTAALSGATQWSDSSSSPIGKIAEISDTVRQNCGIPGRELSLVIGAAVWTQLKRHPELIDRMKYTSANGVLSEQQVAGLLDVKEMIVGNGVYNNAAEGATAVPADIWGKYALLAYIEPNPTPMAAHGIGFTAQKRGRPQGQVETWREEPRSNMLQVSWYEARVVTQAKCGYLLSSAVA